MLNSISNVEVDLPVNAYTHTLTHTSSIVLLRTSLLLHLIPFYSKKKSNRKKKKSNSQTFWIVSYWMLKSRINPINIQPNYYVLQCSEVFEKEIKRKALFRGDEYIRSWSKKIPAQYILKYVWTNECVSKWASDWVSLFVFVFFQLLSAVEMEIKTTTAPILSFALSLSPSSRHTRVWIIRKTMPANE